MSALTDVPDLAPRVIQLWETRGRLKVVGRMSDTAQDWLRAYAKHEVLSIGKRPVLETRTQVRKPYRRFNTEKLKRCHRAEYERCRVLVPRHTVKNPQLEVPAVDYGEGLPTAPRDHQLKELQRMVTLNQAYQEKLRLAPVVRELRAAEDQLKSELEVVVSGYLESGKWDGTEFAFDDGWVYGARVRKFSTDIAAEILTPEVLEMYSQEVPEQVVTQVMVLGPDGRRTQDGGPDANPFEGD